MLRIADGSRPLPAKSGQRLRKRGQGLRRIEAGLVAQQLFQLPIKFWIIQR
jgi:hypothetical protein